MVTTATAPVAQIASGGGPSILSACHQPLQVEGFFLPPQDHQISPSGSLATDLVFFVYNI